MSEPGKPTRRRLLFAALKIAVSVTLLAVLVRRYGGDASFRATLRGVEPLAFLQAEAVLALGLLVSAVRWKLLLRAAGVALPFGVAVRLYFVSFFFNFLLPTSVGGDVVRAMGVGGGTRVPVVVGSILVERLLGFGCLLVIGTVASFAVPSLGAARAALTVASVSFALFTLLLVAVPLPAVSRGGALGRLLTGLVDTAREVRAYGFHGSALAVGLLLSVGWQLALVLANGMLSAGLGGVVSWGSLFALVPVVQAVTMIPVSFGGLGLREMGYEYFLGAAGFDPAGAVALAACFLGVSLSLALKGGLVYLIAPSRAS
ncbi:MAG: lysylphosphatidylglycerol synthase transmembrane domain-containing protein [Candidatus Eiseniibacteriota bacterium]